METTSKKADAKPVMLDKAVQEQVEGKKFMSVKLEFFEKQDGKISINIVPYRTTDNETDPNKIALSALMVAGVQKSLQHILHVLDEGKKAKAAANLPRK